MPSEFQFIDNRERLFGREDDIKYLQARAGRTGFTALTGPPRMGKTWCLREFCRRTCENADFLIGYAESHGEGDLLRAAVSDLYLRWFSNASFGEQAKKLWRAKKDGFFTRFTAKTVEVASNLVEAAPVLGRAAKPFLEAGKTLFAALADADAGLRGQNLKQDLTYDQAFETLSMLAEVTNRGVILVLDAFDQIPDPRKQLGVLNGFLSNADSWPQTHVFAAIRQNVTGEPAGEVGALCRMFPIAIERIIGGMVLKDSEGTRLVSYLRERIPVTRELPPADLVSLTDNYAAIVGRWLDRRDDISSMADLEQEAQNARQNRYPEFERFREMPPADQRLGMRFAILRQLGDRADWELFRPFILQGLPGADLAHLQAQHLLKPTDYPTYGHETRHRGAMDWFAGALPAPFAEETDHVIRAVAARVRDTGNASWPFSSALYAMAFQLSGFRLSSEAKAMFESMMCLSVVGIKDKARRNLVAASARRAAVAWPDCAALVAMGLFNALHHAKMEDGLPRRDALLQELRDLRKDHPDDATVRERLAMGLLNTLRDAKVEDELPHRDALLQELRDLRKDYPDDAAVQKQMAMGLLNTLNHAKIEEDLPRRDALLQGLRDLKKGHPDNTAAREQLAVGLFNTLCHAKAEDDLLHRDALLQELRDLRKDHPDDAVVRKRLAMGLFNTLNHAEWEDDLSRRDALLQELRDLSKEHPDDAGVRESFAIGLFNTHINAEAEDDLPRRDALLEELRVQRKDHPDDATVRALVVMGLFRTVNHLEGVDDRPDRDVLLQELRDLRKDHPDNAIVREQLAVALFRTRNHAKVKDDLPRRDALLQELRDLRKDHPDDVVVPESLAMGLFNTLNDAKAEDDLPRRDALLQELRDLRKGHPGNGVVREHLGNGLYNTLTHAKAEGDLPRRDAILQELRDLRKDHPEDASVRQRIAVGLSNTLTHAKAEGDLSRREVLLQELRDLGKDYPDDATVRHWVAIGLFNTLNDAKVEDDLVRRDALLRELRDLSVHYPEDKSLVGLLKEIGDKSDAPPRAG